MRLELKKLNVTDDVDIYKMLQEIPKDENGYINPVNGMTFDKFKEWLIKNNNLSKSTELIDGWKVPSSTYWLYIDEKPVGVGKVRHFLTEKLQEEGGHIGYAIRPCERKKGFGRMLLKELINEASILGIPKILLTIRKDNIYSLKVAIDNGGIIERKNDIRYFIWINCNK